MELEHQQNLNFFKQQQQQKEEEAKQVHKHGVVFVCIEYFDFFGSNLSVNFLLIGNPFFLFSPILSAEGQKGKLPECRVLVNASRTVS